MAIILRQNKGSELTFAEVDGNFSSLLFDVGLTGSVLNFYTNDGANVETSQESMLANAAIKTSRSWPRMVHFGLFTV